MNRSTHPVSEGRGGDLRGAADDDAAVYIARIADRIRSIRARRGMTRKLLSRHSDISERYLAQIESGQANISVALLWRVAHAMGVNVQELLPDHERRPRVPAPLHGLLSKLEPAQVEEACALLERELLRHPGRIHGVALIGLRGAGKSELGRSLSAGTGVPFIDLVDVVEKLSGMEVGELFSLRGQAAYRRLEQQALDHVIENCPVAIVEAGGSLVTQASTYRRLLRCYYTVWVKARPDEHMQRVVAQGDFRPMQGNLDAMDDLKRILAEREPEYRAAHYVLDTSGRSIDDCLGELVAQTRERLLRVGANPAAVAAGKVPPEAGRR